MRFMKSNDNKGVIEWLSDWPQRAEAKPWMLLNLAVCLRTTNSRRIEAGVSRRFELSPTRATPTSQMLAFDEAYTATSKIQATLSTINVTAGAVLSVSSHDG
jgi:hypothetical protein